MPAQPREHEGATSSPASLDRHRDEERVIGEPTQLRPVWAWAIALTVLVGLAYFPAHAGGFLWQDDSNITKNPLLESAPNLKRIWFDPYALTRATPLADTLLLFERSLFGANPVGYRLASCAIHLANALLIWLLLARLRISRAWLVAAVFALHPVQVEAVAWISQTGVLLATFFYLAALIAYLRFNGATTDADLPLEEQPMFSLAHHPVWAYSLTVVFFLLALTSHPIALTWPVVAWLVSRWKLGSDARLRGLAPFIVIAVAALAYDVWLELAFRDDDFALRWETLGTRLWLDAAALVFLIMQPLRVAVAAASISVWLSVVAGLFAVIAIVLVCRSSARKGGAVSLAIGLYVLIAVVGLLFEGTPMESGVAPLSGVQYLACVAPLALLVAAMNAAIARRAADSESSNARPPVRWALPALVVAALTSATFATAMRYRSEQDYWSSPAFDANTRLFAQRRFGSLALNSSDPIRAAAHYEAALAIAPHDRPSSIGLAMALELQSQPNEAYKRLGSAYEHNRDDAAILAALAGFESRHGLADRAVDHYTTALLLRPDDPAIHNDFGLYLETLNQLDRAIGHYRSAIDANPRYIPARLNLATALFKADRYDESAEQLQAVQKLDPRNYDAYATSGALLAQMQHFADAERMFRNALLIKSDEPQMWNNLGIVMKAQGKESDANWYFAQAERMAARAATTRPDSHPKSTAD